MKKAITLLLLTLSAAGAASAQQPLSAGANAGVDDLVRSAQVRDPELARLELAARRLELGYALEDRVPAVSISIGTAGSGVVLRTSEADWGITATPFVDLSLDGEHGIRGSASFEGGTDPLSVGPALDYQWNVGSLGASREDELTEVTRHDARADAEDRIADRRAALREAVLSALRELLRAERFLAEAVREEELAREELSEGRALGRLAEGSAGELAAEVELARARRAVDLRNRDLEEAQDALTELTGRESVETGAFALPELSQLPVTHLQGPAYAAALRDYGLAELRHAAPEGEPPSLALEAGYAFTPEEFHSVSAGSELAFTSWSVSLSTEVQLTDPTQTITALTFSYTNVDRGARRLEEEISRNERLQAEARLEIAEAALVDERSSLATQEKALLEDILRLEEDRFLAELRLTEARRRVERGLAGEDSIEALQFELAGLDVDERILALEILSFNARVSFFMGE
jgi:hypothetical protein